MIDETTHPDGTSSENTDDTETNPQGTTGTIHAKASAAASGKKRKKSRKKYTRKSVDEDSSESMDDNASEDADSASAAVHREFIKQKICGIAYKFQHRVSEAVEKSLLKNGAENADAKEISMALIFDEFERDIFEDAINDFLEQFPAAERFALPVTRATAMGLYFWRSAEALKIYRDMTRKKTADDKTPQTAATAGSPGAVVPANEFPRENHAGNPH